MTFAEVINSPEALQFRSRLDIAANPTCRRCVCSLFLPPSDSAATLSRPPASAHDNNLIATVASDLHLRGRQL
jgi:hypothetical protein